MAIKVNGNIGFKKSVMEGINDRNYRLQFKNVDGIGMDFESDITNDKFIVNLLFTGRVKKIFVGQSRETPGLKILIKPAAGNEIDITIKDDIFGDVFNQRYLIDDNTKKVGEKYLQQPEEE